MLRSLNDLEHYVVNASDGEIGRVVDFLLDDLHWAVRYLVVETSYLSGRRVLVSPISFRQADWSTHTFHVDLTKDKVKHSPDVDVARPVSRQHEKDFYGYYGYPYYWGYAGLWGAGVYPGLLAKEPRSYQPDGPSDKLPDDIHLRSANELRGYHIQGTDAEVGHVADFVVDDATWEIRYLAIDTRNWWFGKKVLIAPTWAKYISWEEAKVHVELSRDQIKASPEWNANDPVNREYEERLYDYYGRPSYWTAEDLQPHPAVPPPLRADPPGGAAQK